MAHSHSHAATPASDESFLEWNERMVAKYDPEAYHLSSHPLIRWIERQRVQAITALLQARTDSRVLEVGCGAGNILEQIPSRSRVGLDLSQAMVMRAKSRLAQPGDHVIQGSGDHLPFPEGAFTRVLCSEVLEHVPEPERVLREMLRVLTPDGRLVISVPNEPLIDRLKDTVRHIKLWTWFRGQGYQSPDKMTDEWHLHAFDLPHVLALVRPLAHIETIRRIPFPWLPIRYVLALVPLHSSRPR